MLNTNVRSEALIFPQNASFQPDEAPFYIRLDVCSTLLKDLFPNFWTAGYESQSWLARSSDVTPPDLFLWGFVNARLL